MSNFYNNGFLFGKETTTNFTKLPNVIFTLPIDPYQKLVLAYLHSKPDDFIHYRKYIGQVLGISRQKISRSLIELTRSGYLSTTDNGNSYSFNPDPVLQGVTPGVTESDTVTMQSRVTSGTTRVTLGTSGALIVTSGVTLRNTNKKTEDNKTEYKEHLKKPILKGQFKSVQEFLNSFDHDQLLKFQEMTFNNFIISTDPYFKENQYDLQHKVFTQLKTNRASQLDQVKNDSPTPVKEKTSTKVIEIESVTPYSVQPMMHGISPSARVYDDLPFDENLIKSSK